MPDNANRELVAKASIADIASHRDLLESLVSLARDIRANDVATGVTSWLSLERSLSEANGAIAKATEEDADSIAERDAVRVAFVADAVEMIETYERSAKLIAHLCRQVDKFAAAVAAPFVVVDEGDDEGDDDPIDSLVDALQQLTNDCAALEERRLLSVHKARDVAQRAAERARNVNELVQQCCDGDDVNVAGERALCMLEQLAREVGADVASLRGATNDGAERRLKTSALVACDDAARAARKLVQTNVALNAQYASDVARARDWLREWQSVAGGQCPDDAALRASEERLRAAKVGAVQARHALELAETSGEQHNESTLRAALDTAQRVQREAAVRVERETLALTALALTHFPELRHRYAAVQVEQFEASEGAARVRRELASYAEVRELDASSAARCVLEAKYNGVSCVLKRFVLADATQRRSFINEVRQLRALQHPFIVKIEVSVCVVDRRRGLDHSFVCRRSRPSSPIRSAAKALELGASFRCRCTKAAISSVGARSGAPIARCSASCAPRCKVLPLFIQRFLFFFRLSSEIVF